MDVCLAAENYAEAEEFADKLLALEASTPFIRAQACFTKSADLVTKAFEEGNRQLLTEALEFVDEGLSSDEENYDLVIQKAGVLYQLGRRKYAKWLSKARRLDAARTRAFMKDCWIAEKLV